VLARAAGRWAPLVDDPTWQQVQDRFSRGWRLGTPKYLLTGFLRCATCGRGSSRRRDCRSGRVLYLCLGCQRSLGSVAELDGHVLRRLRGLVGWVQEAGSTSPALLGQAWLQARVDDRRSHLMAQWETTSDRAQRRLLVAGELLARRELDPEGYELVREVAGAEFQTAETALAAARRAERGRHLRPLEDVVREAPGWREALASSSVSARREVLWQLVAQVQSRPQRRRRRPPPDLIWTPLGELLQRARRRCWALRREQP
jgi:hypothetical protein